MGFESKNEEEEFDDQKKENNKDESDDDLRETSDDSEWDKIDWNEDNSGEQEESIWNEIDWSDDKSGEQEESIWNEIDWSDDKSGEKEESIWDEIDWNEPESSEQEEFDPKDPNDEIEPEQFDPNEEGENEFDPNETDGDDENNSVMEENADGAYENINSQSTSTVLVSENKVEIQEGEQEELEKEIEKELEEGVEAINKYLEEEAEFINAYQEMVKEARELEEEREREGEECHKTDEEWEKEVETAAYTAEQLYESMKEIETKTKNEEISKRNEETEQLKEQEEKEEFEDQANNPKEEISEQEQELEQEYEEKEELEQHQVEGFIEEELETEPEPIVDEEEIEKLQEMELEKQFHTVHFNDLINDLYEKQEEKKAQLQEQEQEHIEQTQEATYLQEKLEEQEQELELDYEEKDEVEQHQVEVAIEEELETEPEPIINEEKLEHIKNLEPEKQLAAELFYELIEELANKQNEEKEVEREKEEEKEEVSTEQKIAQIKRELEIPQEINYGETEIEATSQELELEQDTTLPDMEVEEHTEVEENRDSQQELEEILEQNSKIEQEALVEIEQEEEDSDKAAEKNNESAKKLYRQQTGKRPIYANKETTGFKQWLEQKKEFEEKEKAKQKQEPKEEKKKEESWKWVWKNWIENTEFDPELKSELEKLVEEYDELEKLIKKYSQLYNKAQREKLSQAEKDELKSLIEALQKLNPIKIELFLSVREIKRYLEEQYYQNDFWDEPRVNRIRRYFFTYLLKQYKSLKEAQKKKNIEDILKNWIEKASEEEISFEMKVELIEIVENYNELEELAIIFMELYKKEQLEQISQSEKMELKALIKTLEKLDPINIVLFANIRAIKHYLNDQHLDDFSDKMSVNRILNRIFTQLSQKYKELRKEQKNGKTKYLINKNNCRIKKSFLESEDFKYVVQDINLKERQTSMTQNQNKTKKEGLNTNNSTLKLSRISEVNGSNSKVANKSNKPKLPLEKRHEYLQRIIELSRKENITVLSKEYFNNMAPLELECKICKNKWTDFRANIMEKVKRNTFKCPYCNRKSKVVLFEYFKNLAIERGGKLLSPKFLGTTKPHLWYCNKHNYAWKAKPNNVKDHPSKKGSWCPKCAIASSPQNNYRYAIEDMQRIAESKAGGGQCISPNFLGVTKSHLWKCGTCGHIWEANPCEIIGKPSRPEGSWCPNCASGRSERICKNFFQELFGKEFHKENKLSWLKKCGLHLDGYNEELKLAFESHGIQHYIYHPYFHKDNPELFEKQKRTDDYKRKECEKHGIVLIEVGYEWRNGKLHKIKIKEMENYIRKNCIANGIYPPSQAEKINWREFDVSLPNYVKKLQEIAKQRDGKLLSLYYFGEVISLEWYCNKHDFIWKATPSDVRGKPSKPEGTWCPKCSQERHKNKMKQITRNYVRDSNGRFTK